MKILIVGGGKGGSWQIRGEQLGAALGARVTSTPTSDDLAWADIVVLVKRAALQWAPAVRAHGLPLVWDALDFWAQPMEHSADEFRARAKFRSLLNVIKPTVTLGATEHMTQACDGVYLPHHSWPGLTPKLPRGDVAI